MLCAFLLASWSLRSDQNLPSSLPNSFLGLLQPVSTNLSKHFSQSIAKGFVKTIWLGTVVVTAHFPGTKIVLSHFPVTEYLTFVTQRRRVLLWLMGYSIDGRLQSINRGKGVQSMETRKQYEKGRSKDVNTHGTSTHVTVSKGPPSHRPRLLIPPCAADLIPGRIH